MAKIYRLSDRIKLKIHDLTVTIGPLSIHQKTLVQEVADNGSLLKATMEVMRYAIKDIQGLTDANGGEYSLNKDENGYLDDDTLNDLFNIQESYELSAVCLTLLNSVPSEFTDPNTGEVLKGVEFIVDKDKKPRKKNKAASGN